MGHHAWSVRGQADEPVPRQAHRSKPGRPCRGRLLFTRFQISVEALRYRCFVPFAAAFARFCLTLNSTIRSIRPYGMGRSSGNLRLPFSPA